MTFPSKEALAALHAYRSEFMRVNCFAPRFITTRMLEKLGIDIVPLAESNSLPFKAEGVAPHTFRILGMDIVDSIPGFTFAGYPYSLVEKVFEDSQAR